MNIKSRVSEIAGRRLVTAVSHLWRRRVRCEGFCVGFKPESLMAPPEI